MKVYTLAALPCAWAGFAQLEDFLERYGRNDAQVQHVIQPEEAQTQDPMFALMQRGLMDQTSKYSFLDKLNGSRCWCSFDASTIFKGRSVPLDAFDEACKDLVHGYKCIKQQSEMEGKTCEPGESDYNILVSGKVLVTDPQKAFSKCEKFEDACSRNSCKIELHFIMNVVDAIHNGVDPANFSHTDDDFDFDSFCPRPKSASLARLKQIHEGDTFRCCGDYPRVRTYQHKDGQMQCCGSKVYDSTVNKCCDASTSFIDYICLE